MTPFEEALAALEEQYPDHVVCWWSRDEALIYDENAGEREPTDDEWYLIKSELRTGVYDLCGAGEVVAHAIEAALPDTPEQWG